MPRTVKVTRVPRLGTESISAVPLTLAIRVRMFLNPLPREGLDTVFSEKPRP